MSMPLWELSLFGLAAVIGILVCVMLAVGFSTPRNPQMTPPSPVPRRIATDADTLSSLAVHDPLGYLDELERRAKIYPKLVETLEGMLDVSLGLTTDYKVAVERAQRVLHEARKES